MASQNAHRHGKMLKEWNVPFFRGDVASRGILWCLWYCGVNSQLTVDTTLVCAVRNDRIPHWGRWCGSLQSEAAQEQRYPELVQSGLVGLAWRWAGGQPRRARLWLNWRRPKSGRNHVSWLSKRGSCVGGPSSLVLQRKQPPRASCGRARVRPIRVWPIRLWPVGLFLVEILFDSGHFFFDYDSGKEKPTQSQSPAKNTENKTKKTHRGRDKQQSPCFFGENVAGRTPAKFSQKTRVMPVLGQGSGFRV